MKRHDTGISVLNYWTMFCWPCWRFEWWSKLRPWVYFGLFCGSPPTQAPENKKIYESLKKHFFYPLDSVHLDSRALLKSLQKVLLVPVFLTLPVLFCIVRNCSPALCDGEVCHRYQHVALLLWGVSRCLRTAQNLLGTTPSLQPLLTSQTPPRAPWGSELSSQPIGVLWLILYQKLRQNWDSNNFACPGFATYR